MIKNKIKNLKYGNVGSENIYSIRFFFYKKIINMNYMWDIKSIYRLGNSIMPYM